ncbi:hypothetical protein N658DRAFT_498319 [Parathielavia hyrcaniae]|uniref:C2H2-type domain-containing protein n=1 Tax=Parathielavia hyrcaniae TaxID=113614 RepID=A0AAN6T0A8_9PEZI|nr:hypothetical protein N658DRAFT_498319 [Parathielavia hyrcaniae]
MDSRLHGAVPEGSSQKEAGHFSTAQFNAVPYLDNLVIAGQDAAATQPLGDPMELDFDSEAALWAGTLDYSVNHHFVPDMNLDYCAAMTSMPADFLFTEDEGPLPAAPSYYVSQPRHAANTINVPPHQPAEPSPTQTVFPVPRSDVGSDDANEEGAQSDVAHQRLRRQLSLLSKGWAGDEIRFKKCDSSKALVLHNLAMELGLGYSHDVRSREVSMSRLGPVEDAPKALLPSSLQRSSTELDSTLCLPTTLPAVSEMHAFELTTRYAHESGTRPASAGQPDVAAQDQPLVRRPSRSERISDSISKLKSIAKGGRRGPLSETGRRDMRALETAGGACWRCKVLRRKCDPGSPCRCCLQSVPMPHFSEDAPLWPLIGCRRGPLRDAAPPQLLCPDPKPPRHGGLETARWCRSADVAERCLLMAESQRIADMKAVLEGASYKPSISDPTLNACFCSFVEAGQYRDRVSLQRNYLYGMSTVTYTELIAVIAWELAENQALMPSLEVRSWDNFMRMLETAAIYESEVGQTSLVILSMVCLRHCLEALRLHSANLLSGGHEECGGGQCQVECIRNLGSQVAAYVDELSSVIFNKENMRDRRWWLSTFYSLYIQSYVRHALIIIEKQLRFLSAEDVPAEDLTATQYMHLPAVLFTAASAKYDPLLDGRLQYSLTDSSVIPETSVPELHHSAAREACEVDTWPEAGIRTPYQFLRRLLQIGSLDFSESGLDASVTGSKSPAFFSSPSSARGKIGSPAAVSPRSLDEALPFPKPPFAESKRDSWNSRYSGQPSTKFSNMSSDSLARTVSTEKTSLYESSIMAGIPFSPSVTDLSSEVCLNSGTINPVLFSIHHNSSSQSLDQVVARSFGRVEVPGPGSEPTFVCNCCPRTPRHFYTSEELLQHEAEKPHPCGQCKKRFKSPTECERHVNAIHLKADFWSCRALEDPLLAYHAQTYRGVVFDVCGFCGGEFARRDSDGSGGGGLAAPDREALVAHMQSVHRVADCDWNKKFYRADNFRQHLKNTHVALPGRWLRALERACRSAKEAGG